MHLRATSKVAYSYKFKAPQTTIKTNNQNPRKVIYQAHSKSFTKGTLSISRSKQDDILSKVELVDPLQIPASVKLFSACQDNQESLDGDFNGRFTGILKAAWNGGKFSGSYYQFYKQILNRFAPYPEQSPNYSNIGKQNIAFDNQKPFMI